MKKTLLFLAVLFCSIQVCSAQYLYGTSVAAGTFPSLVRFDPANNSFVTILKFFEYYQPSSTKDTTNKIIYFLVPNMSPTSDAPDTLLTFKLSDSSVVKKPITKGALSLIEYTNGRLISASANGMAAYDLATDQYSIIDSTVKITNIHSAAYDQSRGRYIFMKRTNNSGIADTLFVYTVATRSLAKFAAGVSGTSTEMRYSPTSNKVLFLGVLPNTANYGIYSINLPTQAFALEAAQTNSGTLVNCATFDENNNRYFAVKTTNNLGTGFNILEYRLNTNTVVDHLVGPPGLGFSQYFNNTHLPIPPTPSSIAAVSEDEPFNMYPNPAKGVLNVTIERNSLMPSIRVMDISGKVILEKPVATEKNTFGINALPAGTYVLSIGYTDRIYSRIFRKEQ